MSANTRFYIKPLNYLITAFFFGLASLAAPLIIKRVEANHQIDGDSVLITALRWIANESGSISIGLLLIALALHLASVWIQSFWDGNITPLLNDYAGKIKESTDTAKNAINDFQEEMSERIRSNNLDLAVAHSNHEALQSRLEVIHEKAFGEHCSKEKGLYNHINNTIGKFLDPRVPHRSDYFQEIHISEEQGKIIWQETTKYSLHTIALDNEYRTPFDGTIEPYEFTFKSQAKYEDFPRLEIKIFVDDKLYVTTQNVLHVTQVDPLQIRSDDPRIKVSTCGSTVAIEIPCCIEINKAFTRVEVFEKSVLSPDDGHYLSRTVQPIYSYQQTITLPDGWSFDFFYPAAMSWQEPIQRPSKRTIRKNGWIAPGVLMSCRWKRVGE